MTNYFIYLIEVSLCMGIFWGFYILFLRKLSFLILRRIFLLFAAGISWLLPLSNFSFTVGEGNHPLLEMGEQVYILEQGVVDQVQSLSVQIQKEPFDQAKESTAHVWTLSAESALTWLYGIGILFFMGKLAFGLYDVLREALRINWQYRGTHWIGTTQEPSSFSFGPLLFLSAHQQSLPGKKLASLLAHEEEHIKQLHTLDILILKVQQSICWINPVWGPWIQETRLVHECSADRAAAHSSSKQDYAQFLLSLTQRPSMSQLAHPFAKAGLKRRVHTLFQPVSSRKSVLRMIPALLLGLVLSLGFSFVRQGELVPPTLQQYLQGMQQTLPSPIQPPYLAPIKDPVITSGYGLRIHPITKEEKFHPGVDFRGSIGTPVYATGDGTVYMDLGATNFSHGWYIEINHGEGIFSHYANLLLIRSEDSIPVRGGDKVKAGDLIGYIGNSSPTSTGPHLHYEIRKGQERLDPMDYLPKDILMGKLEEVMDEDLNGSTPLRAVPYLPPLKNPRLLAGFGQRMHPIFKVKKMHYGVDFFAKIGTEVFATGDGRVIVAGSSKDGYGYQIEIQHSMGGVNEKGEDMSLKTKYAHLKKDGIFVQVGEAVEAGQLIGYTGNTGLSKGPHLHYEVMQGNKKVNPLKFMEGYFPKDKGESMD